MLFGTTFTLNPSSTETVLLVTEALLLMPSFTISYLYKPKVYGLILSVKWEYGLTGYKLSPIKYPYTGNV